MGIEQLKKRITAMNSDWKMYSQQSEETQKDWRDSLSPRMWEVIETALHAHKNEGSA